MHNRSFHPKYIRDLLRLKAELVPAIGYHGSAHSMFAWRVSRLQSTEAMCGSSSILREAC
jgi:hypothetical protein